MPRNVSIMYNITQGANDFNLLFLNFLSCFWECMVSLNRKSTSSRTCPKGTQKLSYPEIPCCYTAYNGVHKTIAAVMATGASYMLQRGIFLF